MARTQCGQTFRIVARRQKQLRSSSTIATIMVLRKMTRMQLIRTLAAWRPDLTDYRGGGSAYRITLPRTG